MPRLSAIVPATDGRAAVAPCRAAIEAAREAPDELIVVDAPPGSGPAAARNAGAARTTGDVLVFVDSDVEVHPDAFVRVRRAFERDPDLVAVFGSYDDRTGEGAVAGFRNLLHHHIHQSCAGPAITFWAGLGAIRRDAFERAGGFDARRFGPPCVEDVELGMRLAAAGSSIELDPDLLGTHLKEWNLTEMVRTDLTGRGIPWVVLCLEQRAAPPVLNLGWRHRLSAIAALSCVGLAATRRRRGAGVALAALLGLNRSFYSLLLRRMGPRGATIGVGLHVLHLLTAAASVPAGAGTWLASGGRRPAEPPPADLAGGPARGGRFVSRGEPPVAAPLRTASG